MNSFIYSLDCFPNVNPEKNFQSFDYIRDYLIDDTLYGYKFLEPEEFDKTEIKQYDNLEPAIDDQLFDNNLKNVEFKNKEQKTNLLQMNMSTKVTSKTIGLKRNRAETNLNEDGKKKKSGRKKKDEKEKGEHNKYSPDNIMRKIKSHFLEYVHNKLNSNFKNKQFQFLRLFSKINENLKKDYNIELMKKTIKEIYENSPISPKYRKQKITILKLIKL